MIFIGLVIIPFQSSWICFSFVFKDIINLLACGRHYVAMGKVFMIQVQSLAMLFDEDFKLFNNVPCYI
jgi:hypothetical protein